VTMGGKIELVGGDHEHTLGMSQTRNGITIRYATAPLMPVFEKMIAERAYEACEFSMANYIMLKDRGADWLFALPVFPQRAFRHANFYVRRDSPLEHPSQLRGKRIAVPEYSMTLAVWMRGILSEQYGVHWSEMHWTTGRRQRFPTLTQVDVAATDQDLERLLLDRQIDVLLAPRTRDAQLPRPQRHLRSLISDAQAAEEAYLAQTGIYPINHVVVVRADALDRLPNLAGTLFDAFQACKAAAYQRRLGTTLVPWGARHWTRMFEKFGGDPLPYGMTPSNRMTVRRLAEFLYDQKLTAGVPDIDSLFPLNVGCAEPHPADSREP
jgi:4,5-dihydroxyphthalate decarboxylase